MTSKRTNQNSRKAASFGAVTKATKSGIFSVIGWIMGAFSFLNLIRDFKLVNLYGLVADWVSAYGLFVRNLTELMFGWVPTEWGRIDSFEAHGLVIGMILAGTLFRSATVELSGKILGSSVLIAYLLFIYLQTEIGSLGDSVWLWVAFVFFVVVLPFEFWLYTAWKAEILKSATLELLAISALVVLIVAINYAVVAP